MQAYDLIMLIVLAMATIFGAIKGFAWQVASIASVIVSYIVAYRFRFDVAEMIQAKPPWNQFLAMLILYVGTSFVIWVAFRLLSGMIDKVRLKEFDRHLGAAFGLAKGGIYCLLITMFAMSLLGPNQQAAICQSRSGYYISVALDRGVGILPKEIHDVVGPYLAQLDDKLNGAQGTSNLAGESSESAWPGFESRSLQDAFRSMPELPQGLTESMQGIPMPGQLPGQTNPGFQNGATQQAPVFPGGQSGQAANGIFPPLSNNQASPSSSSSGPSSGAGNGLRQWPAQNQTPQNFQSQPGYPPAGNSGYNTAGVPSAQRR